ncbi:MAG: SRPBCC domain-containing protein [Calditrichaceae bacterium]
MANQNLRLSEETVLNKTGKTWDEWFHILDSAEADSMDHKDIAAYLNSYHEVGPWWAQMLTVTYEQARGIRKPHEKPDGFEISKSKTINAPPEKLFDAWNNPELRSQWLSGTSPEIRTANPYSTLRFQWIDRKSIVSVNLYPRKNGKCQVVVQHSKLRNSDEAKKMKDFWSERLEDLKKLTQE